MIIKPKFRIGFELEGLIRDRIREIDRFDDGLHNIHAGIDRGEDGSVGGRFTRTSSWEYEGYNRGFGVEIRTPPLEIEKGMLLFEKILNYLEERSSRGDFKTNRTCGLHVNLSEEYLAETHPKFVKFFAHLVSIFPEMDILKMFGRSNNTFCCPLFQRSDFWCLDKWEDARILPLWVEQKVSEGRFAQGKYHSAGIHSGAYSYNKACERRIEFRCLGNKNYHLESEKLYKALEIIQLCATEAFYRVVEPNASEDSLPQRLACAA